MAMIGKRPLPQGQVSALNPLVAGDMPLPPMSAPPVALSPSKPGINWLGVLADALSGAAGQPGMYAQRMARERQEQNELERGEVQYRRRRADNNDDWMQRQKWEQANKAPHRWESNDGSLMEMGPDGTPRVAYKDPTPKERWVFDPQRGYININAMEAPKPRVFKTLPGQGGQTPPASGNFR